MDYGKATLAGLAAYVASKLQSGVFAAKTRPNALPEDETADRACTSVASTV